MTVYVEPSNSTYGGIGNLDELAKQFAQYDNSTNFDNSTYIGNDTNATNYMQLSGSHSNYGNYTEHHGPDSHAPYNHSFNGNATLYSRNNTNSTNSTQHDDNPRQYDGIHEIHNGDYNTNEIHNSDRDATWFDDNYGFNDTRHQEYIEQYGNITISASSTVYDSDGHKI